MDSERLETGIVQCGDDWPGVFIRGDGAFAAGMALDAILRGDVPATGGDFAEELQRAPVVALRDLLLSANVREHHASVRQPIMRRSEPQAARPASVGEDGWPDRIYLAPPEFEDRMWCEDRVEYDWREYILAVRRVEP